MKLPLNLRRRPTRQSIRANLAWLWRWKIASRASCRCGGPARVYTWGRWLCTRCAPPLVSPKAAGIRRPLFVYTRKATEDLFRSDGSAEGGLLAMTRDELKREESRDG